jgi:hypothetical protein
MADLVKLRCSVAPSDERQVWAGSRQSSAGELTQFLHHANFDNKGGKQPFAAI